MNLNRYKNFKTIFIDSAYRTKGSHEDFTVKFDNTLQDYSAFRIDRVSIPFSFYNIRLGINDSLDLKLGVTTYVITVPEGQYTTEQLRAELELQIQTDTADATFNVVYSGNTLKYNINKPAGAFNLYFETGANAGKLGNVLGFEETDLIGLKDYTGNYAVKLIPRYISIVSTKLDALMNGETQSNCGRSKLIVGDNVILRMPIDVDMGYNITYQNVNNEFYFANATKVNILDFKLVCDDCSTLDLHDASWNIQLTFFNVAFTKFDKLS